MHGGFAGETPLEGGWVHWTGGSRLAPVERVSALGSPGRNARVWGCTLTPRLFVVVVGLGAGHVDAALVAPGGVIWDLVGWAHVRDYVQMAAFMVLEGFSLGCKGCLRRAVSGHTQWRGGVAVMGLLRRI